MPDKNARTPKPENTINISGGTMNAHNIVAGNLVYHIGTAPTTDRVSDAPAPGDTATARRQAVPYRHAFVTLAR